MQQPSPSPGPRLSAAHGPPQTGAPAPESSRHPEQHNCPQPHHAARARCLAITDLVPCKPVMTQPPFELLRRARRTQQVPTQVLPQPSAVAPSSVPGTERTWRAQRELQSALSCPQCPPAALSTARSLGGGTSTHRSPRERHRCPWSRGPPSHSSPTPKRRLRFRPPQHTSGQQEPVTPFSASSASGHLFPHVIWGLKKIQRVQKHKETTALQNCKGKPCCSLCIRMAERPYSRCRVGCPRHGFQPSDWERHPPTGGTTGVRGFSG